MDLYYQRKGVKSDKKLEKIMTDTWHLLKTAKELGIKYEEIPYTGIFRLEYRGKVEFLYHRTPVQTTSTASRCCDNKMVTKNLLERAGLAVPSGYMLKEQDGQKYQLEVFDKVKKPLVVKAIDGSEALHVSLNITKTADYLKALKSSFSYDRIDNSRALVEEMFVGDEFRILATREKVLSIIYRIEANVVGTENTLFKN